MIPTRSRAHRDIPLWLILAFTVALAGALSTASAQGSWPNWRGPTGNGVAPDADPPIEWSADENIAWVTPLPGHGKSTPIVIGERIFLQAAVRGERASEKQVAVRKDYPGMMTEAPKDTFGFLVLAIQRSTGDVLWESVVQECLPIIGVHGTNGYASFTPVADGDGVYVSFGSYGVYALEPETGDVRWSYQLGPQVTRRGWGEGGSPTLVDDTLFVLADQEGDSFLVALDTKDGSVRWKQARDEPSTWTTPLCVESKGTRQLVVNGTTAARGYALDTGEVLWHCNGQTVNAIPSPVSDGNLVLITSGYRGSTCVTLPLSIRGDARAKEGGIAWSARGGTPYVPSPILVDGRVYMTSGNAGLLSCFDFQSGERMLDRERLDLGQVYASPLAAAGRLYITGRDGTTVVLRHTDELEVLATNVLDDPIDASPVAVGKALFLRSEENLYAIGKP